MADSRYTPVDHNDLLRAQGDLGSDLGSSQVQHHRLQRVLGEDAPIRTVDNGPRNFNNFFKFGAFLSYFGINVDALNKGATAMFSNPFVKYLTAPLTIVTSFFSILFAMREAAIRKNKHSKLALLVEILTGGAMIAAAIGVIAAAAVFSFVAPILISAAFGLKTLFDLGSAIYYGVKGDRDRMWNHLGAFTVGAAFTAVSVTLMMVAGPVVQAAMAVTGLVLSAAAMTYIMIRGLARGCSDNSNRVSSVDEVGEVVDQSNDFGSTKVVGKVIGATKDTQVKFARAIEGKKVVEQQDPSFVEAAPVNTRRMGMGL